MAPAEDATDAILTVPNAISLARLAAVPVFVWLFVTEREGPAVILYGAAAWTDFLDGYIARRTGAVSELGRLLDPLADRIFIIAIAIALVARGALGWWIAAAVIGRDVIVLGAFPLLEKRGVERLRVNFVGKTATFFLLLGLTLLAWSETTFPGTDPARVGGTLITVGGAVLYWVAGVLYGRAALRLMGRAPARDGSGAS